MENQFSDDDYIKIYNKKFKKIGNAYSSKKTKMMAFMKDGIQELEEPAKTYTSLNFAWEIIMDWPGKSYVLMSRPQAIRFIRVVKQRILKVLDTDIPFINEDYSPVLTERFIQKLTNRIRDITAKYNITDSDLYRDNPKMLQAYIVDDMYKKPYVPNESSPPSPMYDPNLNEPSPEYKVAQSLQVAQGLPTVVQHSDIVKTNISEFQLDMEEIDEQDKSIYTEEDTPMILDSIASLKKEFLDKFTYKINGFFEQTYKEELEQLMSESIKHYTERLVGIRRAAHFKGGTGFQAYNKTRIDVRKEKEMALKKLSEKKPIPRVSRRSKMIEPTAFADTAFGPNEYPPPVLAQPAFAPPALAPPPYAPTAFAPPPFAEPPFAPTAFAPPAFAKQRPPLPKPRTRKQKTNVNSLAKQRPPLPKPRTRKVKTNVNSLAKPRPPLPKPRTRKVKMNVKGMNVKGTNVQGMNVKKMNVQKPSKPKPRTRKTKKNTYEDIGIANAARKFNQPNTSL